jgi:hypothetical protein
MCARGDVFAQIALVPTIEETAFTSSARVPTPTANDWKSSGYQKKRGKIYLNLPGAVGVAKVPTPTAQSNGSNRGGSAGRVGKVRHNLESLAKLKAAAASRPSVATPTA